MLVSLEDSVVIFRCAILAIPPVRSSCDMLLELSERSGRSGDRISWNSIGSFGLFLGSLVAWWITTLCWSKPSKPSTRFQSTALPTRFQSSRFQVYLMSGGPITVGLVCPQVLEVLMKSGVYREVEFSLGTQCFQKKSVHFFATHAILSK